MPPVLPWRVRTGRAAPPHPDAVAPIGFGRIEGLICLLQQFSGISRIVGHIYRKTYAESDPYPLFSNHSRCDAHFVSNTISQFRGFMERCFGQQNYEFISVVAATQVSGAQAMGNAAGYGNLPRCSKRAEELHCCDPTAQGRK
jgi:hypothetical protein